MSTPGKKDQGGETVIKRGGKKPTEAGHGGAWKVAFADFCLALTCLFLVMWLLAARDADRIKEVLRSAGGNVALDGGKGILDQSKTENGSLIPREPVPGMPMEGGESQTNVSKAAIQRKQYDSVEDLQKLAQALQEITKEEGLQENIDTKVTPFGLRVILHDTDKQGMFERGSAVMSEHFRSLLLHLAPMFKLIKNQMLIMGHTDAMQYRNQSYEAFSNWSLSNNRAMAARSALLMGGMPQDTVLQVIGMADRAPFDVKNPLSAVNRRIELMILSSKQARLMSEMFGLPTKVAPLAPGVYGETSDDSALTKLTNALHLKK